jgi:hypothetical protein
MKRILTLTALLLTIVLSSAAHASAFFYSLDDPIQFANPGDTVYFSANLEVYNQPFAPDNPPFFLNGDTFTLDAPLTIDDFWLFIGFSPSFNPGDSEDNTLFTITLPSNLATGTYFGSFTILGGNDDSTFNPLGYDNFSITTVGNPPSVPEPSSLALLGTGLVAIVAALRRKQFDPA